MADVNKIGRPKKFKSVAELDKAIQYYFNSITKSSLAFDTIINGYEDEEKKKPIYEQIPRLNNANEQIERMEYLEIPSITGLCLSVGLTRETWSQYSKQKAFSDSIKRAKATIEKYNIEQLYVPKIATGVIFNLKNNFEWRDQQDLNHSGSLSVQIVDDVD
jgi:hypothetical protein